MNITAFLLKRPSTSVLPALLATCTCLVAAQTAPVPVPQAPQGVHQFVPQITPKGWSKKPDAKLFGGTDGKLNDLGRYYYDLTRDPKNFEAYLKWNFDKRGGNFSPCETPVYKGTSQGYMIHRFCGTIRPTAGLLKRYLPKSEAEKLCNAQWAEGVAQAFSNITNERGLWECDGNECSMACTFHFARTAMPGLVGNEGVRKIWNLERAQKLVLTLLTDPVTFSQEDQWLPASPEYLKKCQEANAKSDGFDIYLIKDGKVFWNGGLFAGWKGKPSMHGTWDGLALINVMYKIQPEIDPNPASPKSVFYLWYKQPESVKARTKHGFALLTKRLWFDYLDHKGPSYCHIVDGKPSEMTGDPGDARHLPDNACYSRDSLYHWAMLSYGEFFNTASKTILDASMAKRMGVPRSGCEALLRHFGLWRDNITPPPNWKDPEAAREVVNPGQTGKSGGVKDDGGE